MISKIIATIAFSSVIAVAGAEIHDKPSGDLEGWHAFVALCAAHGGATDVVRMQRWDGKQFSNGDTIRVECDNIEFVIPVSWYEVGTAEHADESPQP